MRFPYAEVLIFLASLFLVVESDVNDTDAKHADASPRIVGGTIANLVEIHYQVSMQRISSNHSFCGGTIISLNTVLTAAHCLISRNGLLRPNEFRLVSDTNFLNDTRNAQIRFPLRVVAHKKYSDNRGFDNDIGVVILTQPFVTTSTLRQISWRTSSTKTGERCVVSGFGVLRTDGASDGYLRRADVLIADHSQCRRSYGSSVTGNMICAGDSLRDACQGDSGGPLVCGGALAGIVSFGNLCALPGYPGVYTEAQKYTKWIVENNGIATEARATRVGLAMSTLLILSRSWRTL